MDGLATLEKEWGELESKIDSCGFYHTVEWYKSYVDEIDQDLLFFALYLDENLSAIFPLKSTIRQMFGLRLKVLQLPEHPHFPLKDFIFPLTGKTNIIAEFISNLNNGTEMKWDLIEVRGVFLGASLVTEVERGALEKVVVERSRRKTNYFECNDFSDIRAGFSKNFKGNLRKARNKLHKAGEVDFETVRSVPELYDAFEVFLEIEGSGWKGEEGVGTAIKLDPSLVKFYRSLINNFGGEKKDGRRYVEINLLRLNEEVIAAQFCIVVRETVYILKIGYREDYSFCSPGNMLVEYRLRLACEDENIRYVNLVTDMSWHKSWNPSALEKCSVLIWNNTWLGAVSYCAYKIRERLAVNKSGIGRRKGSPQN